MDSDCSDPIWLEGHEAEEIENREWGMGQTGQFNFGFWIDDRPQRASPRTSFRLNFNLKSQI